MKNNPWTKKEISDLDKLYPIYGKAAAEYFPGRSEDAIGLKARRLGINSPTKEKSIQKSLIVKEEKGWTIDKVETLLKFYNTEGPESAAKRIGVTPSAAKIKMTHMGMTGMSKRFENLPVYRSTCEALYVDNRALLSAEKYRSRDLASYYIHKMLNKDRDKALAICKNAEDTGWWNEFQMVDAMTYNDFSKFNQDMINMYYKFIIFEDANKIMNEKRGKQVRDFLRDTEHAHIPMLGLIEKTDGEVEQIIGDAFFCKNLIHGNTKSMIQEITDTATCISAGYNLKEALDAFKERCKKNAGLVEDIKDIFLDPARILFEAIREGNYKNAVVYVEPGLEKMAKNIISQAFPKAVFKTAEYAYAENGVWTISNDYIPFKNAEAVINFRDNYNIAHFMQAIYPVNKDMLVMDFCSGMEFVRGEHSFRHIDLSDTMFIEKSKSFVSSFRKIVLGKWSKTEKQSIKKYYDLSLPELQEKITGRTLNEIGEYRRTHDRYGNKRKSKENDGFHWSDEEIRLLRKYYPTMGGKAQKFLPGRSVGAIWAMADLCGVRYEKRKRYAAWEDAIISHAFKENPTISWKELSEKYLPHRKPMSIYQHVVVVGKRKKAS